MFKIMDTESHPNKNSLTVWGQFLSHLQPVALEHLPDKDPKGFHGRLRLAHLGDLRISILNATEHCLRNQPPTISGKTRQEYVLIMPISGTISVRQGRTDMPLGRDQSLLINISYPVETAYLSPASCLQIMIPEARLRHIQKLLPDNTPHILPCHLGMGRILRNQILGMVNGLSDITCEKVCHSLGEHLINILSVTMRNNQAEHSHKSPEQKRLATILTAIDQQLENPDICTDTVAKAACISRAYLFKLLKRHDTSFRQEVLNRRLTKAKDLLKDPNMAHLQVSDIAWRLGFNSHSHFSRTFQKEMGVSPTDFRRQDASEDCIENQNLELDLSLGGGW
ncbi:AraC family transcriptional regulator [Sansalvadorimonas verongulae]|uniref:AraC family transcriptional regulator n=1 Tax=Sansalvadorimonas verongulae TaxID=2172824 RepID=UPI0012BD3572|nr:AraC family transcriptional regulator [Sansalvadorimonas verongulae]MTI15604.1 AraC family transcriptional regulator [Sansalvadorimonas verongulae]